MTDKEYVKRFAVNDQTAIASFYDCVYHNFVSYFKKRYGKTSVYSKDLFHESYMAMYENIPYKDYKYVNTQSSYWDKHGAIDYIGGLVADSAPDYNDIYYNMLLVSKRFMQKADTVEFLL